MYTILVADDEPIMLRMVEKLLQRDGYNVIKTSSAQGVLETLLQHSPDLILMDVNLPDRNGLSLCQDLRQNAAYVEIPIIFLTGAGKSPDDVAEALNVGGDDYIQKPFAARELSARVRAQLRRVQVRKESNIPQLDLIRAKFLVYINGRPVELTRVEFNLLAFMCRKANTWLTTRDLLMNVWGYPGNVGDAALVRNHIRNIRRKVEVDADRPQILLSRHRRGYMIVAKITIDDTRPARFTKRPRITHKPDSNASNSL